MSNFALLGFGLRRFISIFSILSLLFLSTSALALDAFGMDASHCKKEAHTESNHADIYGMDCRAGLASADVDSPMGGAESNSECGDIPCFLKTCCVTFGLLEEKNPQNQLCSQNIDSQYMKLYIFSAKHQIYKPPKIS